MKFFEYYRYDNNIDLIDKLCDKFKINKPRITANYYGDVDVFFENNLNLYCVQVIDNEVLLKHRCSRNFGQKNTKEHMNVVKKYIDGNIWYQIIKKIAKDSKL